MSVWDNRDDESFSDDMGAAMDEGDRHAFMSEPFGKRSTCSEEERSRPGNPILQYLFSPEGEKEIGGIVGLKDHSMMGTISVSNSNLHGDFEIFDMDEDPCEEVEINTMSLDDTFDPDESEIISNESNSGKFLSQKRERSLSDKVLRMHFEYDDSPTHRFRSESPRQDCCPSPIMAVSVSPTIRCAVVSPHQYSER
jgi:hypothetical protein